MARRRSGEKIDFVHWTGGAVEALAFGAGIVAGTLGVALHEPETLMRLRGNLLAYIDGSQVNGGGVVIGAGIILVPEGTGTTVLWSPLTDSDAPWIWYDRFRLGYEEMVTDVVDVPAATGYRSVIDNKAMRIIRNQEIQVVFENVTFLSAMSVNVGVDIRALSGT